MLVLPQKSQHLSKDQAKKHEWYQGCDLNQYFVNVKDNITLKMEIKG